jgi:predicted DNA-binding transcriptional regulator AlpA
MKPTRKHEPLRPKRETADRILRPIDVEHRYGISGPTRWRWENSGRLPPRDVQVGGEPFGWYETTLKRSEDGQAA